ncbi:MAG: RsbRD N-terminal domain-containing protein [Gemmatimonadales bacterium]
MPSTMRPSQPTLIAIGRALRSRRDRILDDWATWTINRTATSPTVSETVLRRFLAVLTDTLVETAGPLRRQALELWHAATEAYGRTSADRGLAAGEIVEELQYLRELLIRYLSEVITAMPPRASLAGTLRLNRILDKGIAHAVVGYTDGLVEALYERRGVPVGGRGDGDDAAKQRLDHLESELARLRDHAS